MKKENIFERAAMLIYKQACIRKLPVFSSAQVENDLLQLHPGENVQWIRTQYYVKKIALVLMILLAGAAFGAAAKILAGDGIILQEDGSIERGSYREGEFEISVTADLGDEKEDFAIQIQPRQLSAEEMDELAEEFISNLPQLIKGKNEGLGKVTEDLILQDAYEGYPFETQWSSDNLLVVGSGGEVRPQDNDETVKLFVTISCGDFERKEAFEVTVAAESLTERERWRRDLEEYIKTSEESKRFEEKLTLPEKWQDRDIVWSQKVEDNSVILWVCALAVAIAVYIMSDRDLHGRLEKRKKLLKQEYPDLVHRLVLFVGAGMTVRGAFIKIASEHEKKYGNQTGKRPAYDEVILTCRELQSGTSEGAAYEHFGRRTGLQEYIRLSTLLMQNLKRGNSALLERLREEADKAGEERLQQSKRLGEEAGTKLLLPMALMLAIVMVMIIMPAFSAM